MKKKKSVRQLSAVEMLAPYINIEPLTKCFLWTGPTSSRHGNPALPQGHPLAKRFETNSAIRVSYHVFKGHPPDDKNIFRQCRNRHCVNPDHLTLNLTFLERPKVKRR